MFKKFFTSAYEKAKRLYQDIMFNKNNEDAREEYVRQCSLSYSGAIPFDEKAYVTEARPTQSSKAKTATRKDLFKGPFMTRDKMKQPKSRGGFER